MGKDPLRPASNCNEVLKAVPLAQSGEYWIDVEGVSTQLYCDMSAMNGYKFGWTPVYSMCQNGGGDARDPSHAMPLVPQKGQPVRSLQYNKVLSTSPKFIIFGSDFKSSGYMFSWDAITSGNDNFKNLLDGTYAGTPGSCYGVGQPMSGSTGTCSSSMTIQHNNGGSETNDIPTLGCSCPVWNSDGMRWGQIDGLGNYNGVSHVGNEGWNHDPQTSDGCIYIWVASYELSSIGQSAGNPASSCADIPMQSGYFWLSIDGEAKEMYCNEGGWTLVYSMCQNGGGDARSPVRTLPIRPDKGLPVSALEYNKVAALSPTRIRYTSDFNTGSAYDFTWEQITTRSVNELQVLLQGSMQSSDNICVNVGGAISSPIGCSSFYIQHNNGGSESHDIPTIGCACPVWNDMYWGQIDGLGNYNGVSHHSGSWDHSPQTTDGCIHVYVG